MQGLIRMFSISILINITIHLPESEKSGGDLWIGRLFFHYEQKSKWETASLRKKNLPLIAFILWTHFVLLWEQAKSVLFDWCCCSQGLHSEDGAISATLYWICTGKAQPATRYNLWQRVGQQWIYWLESTACFYCNHLQYFIQWHALWMPATLQSVWEEARKQSSHSWLQYSMFKQVVGT